MSASPFDGRRLPVAVLLAASQAWSWAVAAAVTLPLLRPLRAHPDGAWALYGEGGRLLAEVARIDEHALPLAAASLMVATALWVVGWTLFGGVLPALAATDRAPPLHRAAAASLARLPTLAGLATAALAGYGLAGAAGWFARGMLRAQVARSLDPRAVSLHEAKALAPALLVAALVTVWHDLARARAMVAGSSAAGATAEALAWMARAPVSTLGGAAAHACAGWLGPLAAYVASLAWGGRRELFAVAALTAAQQLALAWRFGWRARWVLALGAEVRASRPREASAAP